MNDLVYSPLTLTQNTRLEYVIDCGWLIQQYRGLDVDITALLRQNSQLYLYRCLDTDYCFYYPFDISGDSHFYEQLQRFDWYYTDEKWEHRITQQLVSSADKVLEVGSGNGFFVNRLTSEGIDCTGLELNQKEVASAQRKGLSILNEFIEEHARNNPAKYDFVCSFQVLEHISRVRPFLAAAVSSVKAGGTFVISVPNNGGFMKYAKEILDMPPHHAGLWHEDSLRAMGKLFGLSVQQVLFEPLSPQHYQYYYNIQLSRVPFGKLSKKIVAKLTRRLANWCLPRMASRIRGHTVLVVFKKIPTSES